MTTITAINTEHFYYNGNAKVTKMDFNVWDDEGGALYRVIELNGHISTKMCKKVAATHYLTDEEFFEQYDLSRSEAKRWVYDKFGLIPEFGQCD